MAVKTITITESAYRVLKARKHPEESFSGVIMKMGGKAALLSFYGALSKGSGERLDRAIKEARKRRRELHAARTARLRTEGD